jgi:hypothetical protein
MKRRENSGQRHLVRALQRTILIYCGAVRTEPDYFKGLRNSFRSATLTVKVRQDGVAPSRLVQIASAYRDRKPGAFDEVWCVVDVDQFDLVTAIADAREHSVNLAISNPCFELWLLLHHSDCRSHCTGYADVASRLKKHLPAYDKTRLRFSDHANGVGDAVKRAKELEPSGTNHQRNPSTSVWRLVEIITEAGR